MFQGANGSIAAEEKAKRTEQYEVMMIEERAKSREGNSEEETKAVFPVIEKNSRGRQIVGEALQKEGNQMDVKMLLYNDIPGLLPLQIQYIDDKEYYIYQTAGTSSLEHLFENSKEIGFVLIMEIFDGIVDVIKRGRGYFLQEENYILNVSFLFWNERKSEISICYFPGYAQSLDKQMDELCQYLLQKIEHKDKTCVELVYGMYELLQREGAMVEQLDEFLSDFRKSKEMNNKEARKKQQTSRPTQQKITKKKRKEKEGTAEFSLVSTSKNREMPDRVWIDKENFLIGRSEENDFVLPAAQISRQHARLYREGTQWYLSSQNSTNGVFLNGNRLEERCPVVCRENDMISFADISYRLERKKLQK